MSHILNQTPNFHNGNSDSLEEVSGTLAGSKSEFSQSEFSQAEHSNANAFQHSDTFQGELNQLPGQEFFDLLMSRLKNIELMLFDMDGTLASTEPLHAQAVSRSIDEVLSLKINEEQVLEVATGKTDAQAIASLVPTASPAQVQNVCDLKDKYLVDVIDQNWNQIEFVDFNLLLNLKKSGVKIALVSASERFFVDKMVRAFEKELNQDELFDLTLFDLTLAKGEASEDKPKPAPYKLAMDQLQVSADRTIVFEDSWTGLTAARDSGAHYFHVRWF